MAAGPSVNAVDSTFPQPSSKLASQIVTEPVLIKFSITADPLYAARPTMRTLKFFKTSDTRYEVNDPHTSNTT